METDKKIPYFTHLVNNEICKAISNEIFFQIIDSTSTPFRLWTVLVYKEQFYVKVYWQLMIGEDTPDLYSSCFYQFILLKKYDEI